MAVVPVVQVPVKLAAGLSTTLSATGEAKFAVMLRFVVTATVSGLLVPLASPVHPLKGKEDTEFAVRVTRLPGA